MGGLLAFGIATPVVVACCGGGTALLAATFSKFGALAVRFLAHFPSRFWQRSPSLSFVKSGDLPNAAPRILIIFQTERALLDPEY